ncbi:MAG: hypothetical protein IPF41_11945 [Flavobacteriales bacterium]|nr:hypothetical protein [Flavobacteriales bacterium]
MNRCFILFLLLHGTLLRAQQNDVPLQRDFSIDLERNAASREARIHSGLKPVIESRADLNNVQGFRKDSARYYYVLTTKLFRDRLLTVREGDALLSVDPILSLEYGADAGDASAYADTNQYYFNTRGFVVRGDLGPKVSFYTMFHENLGRVPQYLYRKALETLVLPGQGRVKLVDGNRFDYGWSQGVLSYSPSTWLNVQAGHGKHFVGHGYRSVLLSDNAINSPFLKFSLLSRNKRWQYTWWYSKLMHGVTEDDRLPGGASSENLFHWMRGAFHHLSIDLGRVQLGLFEATLFRSITNRVEPMDPLAINPVIGLNTAAKGFSGPANCLVGTDLRLKITDRIYAYGQFATDGPGRYAWQAGARAFDVGVRGLHLQAEYNTATPFMYMGNRRREAYMHAGQPLANPLGTAFGEAVGIVEMNYKRWMLRGQVNMSAWKRDPADSLNLGTDLDKPDIGSPKEGEARLFNMTWIDASLQWLVNPNTNARLVGGIMRRDLPGAADIVQSSYWYIGLRTFLFNRYYDI